MNKKIEEYKKRANRIARTIQMIAVSILILGIIISVVQYVINKSKSDIENTEFAEVIREEDFTDSKTGKTYYISANGSSEDGTDINKPMSLNIANSKQFKGNDRVLFKCGDTFYGQINFNVETIEDSLFYIGCYGEGSKPIISGARILKDKNAWTLEDGLYKIDLSKTNYFEGLQNWGNLKNYYNIGFLSNEAGNIYGNRKKEKDQVKNEYDFNCENNYLYIKCNSNPTEELGNIKFVCRFNLINLTSNTILENLDIQYTGAHGIRHKNTICDNIIIRNCIIQNIGGSVQVEDSFSRYGNAIEFFNEARNTLVEHCLIKNIYDAGYTVQGNKVTSELGFENNVCRDCIFIKATYDFEAFCWNNVNREEKCNILKQYYYDNISINQGRGWGYEVRPDKDPSANFVLSTIQKDNTKICIEKNLYVNPRKLNHIRMNKINDVYPKCIKSNNNKLYISKETIFIGSQGKNYGSYQDKLLLKKYNIDQDSTFNLLSDDNLEVINNEYIQNLNNYNKIKVYYTFFDEAEYQNKINLGPIQGYKYKKDNQDVILVYNETGESKIPYTSYTATDIFGNKIENTGTLTISKEPILIYNLDEERLYSNVSNDVINKITTYEQKYNTFLTSSNTMKNTNSILQDIKKQAEEMKMQEKTIDSNTITDLIDKTYKQGDNIVKSFKEKEFKAKYEDISNMLLDLNIVAEDIQKYYGVDNNITKIEKSVETLQNIQNFEKIYNYYRNDNLSYLEQLQKSSKQQLESITNETTNSNNAKTLSAYYLSNWAISLINLYNENYISNISVDIAYSTTELTNQDVKATLVSNGEFEVTNNSKAKEYTFTQNGTFTFEYTIKGQPFTKVAEVRNIDKTQPSIAQVTNDALYLDKVTPRVEDSNLQEAVLYKNGEAVTSYKLGDTISADGNYKLTAKDRAGNESNVEFYISHTPAKIEYSNTNLTNQDVVATIVSDFDVDVQNNQKSNKYTFKQNGEFKFRFIIKGIKLNITAKVENIDKTKPKVTGVENGKVYVGKAKPIVKDENLSNIELYLNSNKVENYRENSEITQEGFYKLVAKDKAENETIIEFTIMDQISKEYKIQGDHILNISNNTNKTDFANNLKINSNYEIYRNNQKLSNTDKIATGDTLKLSGGQEYTLIVTGDINKDGDVDIQDLISLRRHLLVKNDFDKDQNLAADSDLDGEPLSIKDLIRMRIIILTKGAA